MLYFILQTLPCLPMLLPMKQEFSFTLVDAVLVPQKEIPIAMPMVVVLLAVIDRVTKQRGAFFRKTGYVRSP